MLQIDSGRDTGIDAEIDTRTVFLYKINNIDHIISKDIKSSDIVMYYDDENEYLNTYWGFKSALACALLFSNYTDISTYSNNSSNVLKFMASNDVLFNNTILLSLCKSNEDINYLKYIIKDTLNCYISLGNKHFYSVQMCLSINPYKYKSIDTLNICTESENDQIIELLNKAINVLENLIMQ